MAGDMVDSLGEASQLTSTSYKGIDENQGHLKKGDITTETPREMVTAGVCISSTTMS